MPSQFPALRLTVAGYMEGYRERLAANIAREMKRRGETPIDVAVAIQAAPRTIERWTTGETEPQIKKLKALAEHWQLRITDLRPDLETEEREVRDQLDRMEAELGRLMELVQGIAETVAAAELERGARTVEADTQGRRGEAPARKPRARGTTASRPASAG